MKIAMVKDCIYPFTKGGGEMREHHFAKEFAAMGHEVLMVGMKLWEGDDRRELGPGLTAVGIAGGMKLYNERGVRTLMDAVEFMNACTESALIKQVGAVDMILADHIPFIHLGNLQRWAKTLGIPLFVTWNETYGYGHWAKERSFVSAIGYALVEKWCLRMGDRIVAISERTQDRLIKAGVRPSRVTIIEGGIDIEAVSLAPPAGAESDVIYSTRLVRHKRVDLFLRAIKEAEEIMGKRLKAVITGDGPLRSDLERLSSELDLDVTFTGWLPELSDVWGHMKRSKVLLHTSQREGFGHGPLEAMACGIPVISSDEDSNAVNALIRQAQAESLLCGFTAQPDAYNMAHWLSKMLNLLDDDDQKQRIAKDCRGYAQRFSWAAGAQKLIEEYSHVRQ